MTEFLDAEDLLAIAEIAISEAPMVRDFGLLASAAARPQTTLFGADAYPSLHLKAAALLHSLTCNHPLVDGNKRLAWLATATFLDINGAPVRAGDDEVVELVFAIADGTLSDVVAIAERLRAWV